MAAESKLIYESQGIQVATIDDCLLVLLAGAMTIQVVNAIDRGFSELSQRERMIGYLSALHLGVNVINDDTRSRMTAVVGRYSKRISAAARVCEGTGFRATAVRSVITAVHFASRAEHPLKVFELLKPALTWLKNRHKNEAMNTTALVVHVMAWQAKLSS
jgi:hypothetical protein